MYWLSHVLTTQDGYAAAGSEPGRPDIVTTRSTPEQAGDLDRAVQVGRVRGPDVRQRVERVAVAVQAGQRDPGVRELAQVVLPGAGAGQQVVDRQVRRRAGSRRS